MINRSPLDVLVLVPARKGSKRLPHKNRLKLGKASLLQHTVSTVKEIGLIGNTLVSTDDDVLAREAVDLGVYSPGMRPDHLAQDSSSTIDVLKYVLGEVEREFSWHPKFVLLLQLTSPFRDPRSISLAIGRIVSDNSLPAIVSGKFAEARTQNTVGLARDHLLDSGTTENKKYVDVDGNFYVGRVNELLIGNSFSPRGSKVIISRQHESIDIDTLNDFNHAQNAWKKFGKEG